MKKTILLSLIASGLIAGNFINPLPSEFKSKDNGGSIDIMASFK